MPSIVWCARAPYHVRHSPSEVEDLIAQRGLPTTDRRSDFIWLDVDGPDDASEPRPQVMLRIDAISAVMRFNRA